MFHLWFSINCFGVCYVVILNDVSPHVFSASNFSAQVAERPTIGKELDPRLTLCPLCIFVICVDSLFDFEGEILGSDCSSSCSVLTCCPQSRNDRVFFF